MRGTMGRKEREAFSVPHARNGRKDSEFLFLWVKGVLFWFFFFVQSLPFIV
jgi:hypothetical protein